MKKYIDAIKQYSQDATTSDEAGACWEGYERVPNTKKGEPGSCRKIGSSKADYKYENPRTGEIFMYSRRGPHKKDGVSLVYKGRATEGFLKGDWDEEWTEYSKAAEYQGRKVTLNKPFLTPDGPKKRSVYVKNEKGNVVKVNFGDPNMKIKKSDPERRKSFRARHNCDNPGPKWKARYWSCKMW
jgi:hypothetical protein